MAFRCRVLISWDRYGWKPSRSAGSVRLLRGGKRVFSRAGWGAAALARERAGWPQCYSVLDRGGGPVVTLVHIWKRGVSPLWLAIRTEETARGVGRGPTWTPTSRTKGRIAMECC